MALALSVLMAAACAQTGSRDQLTGVESDVGVLTFNIQHDREWSARRELVVTTIRDQAPDIVGLQEALLWQLEYLVQRLPEYDFVAAGRDDGRRAGESVGLLFRKARFDREDSGTFWFSDSPDVPGSMPGKVWGAPNFPRICTWLRLIETSTGRGLYVFNVHLQHDAGADPDLARVASVNLLIDRIAKRSHADPVVVIGDFNASENEDPVRLLTRRGPLRYCPASAEMPCRELTNPAPLRDAYRVLNGGSASGTRCFAGADTGRRIDYVFVTAGVQVSAVKTGEKIDGRCASDHRFVLAELEPWPEQMIFRSGGAR